MKIIILFLSGLFLGCIDRTHGVIDFSIKIDSVMTNQKPVGEDGYGGLEYDISFVNKTDSVVAIKVAGLASNPDCNLFRGIYAVYRNDTLPFMCIATDSCLRISAYTDVTYRLSLIGGYELWEEGYCCRFPTFRAFSKEFVRDATVHVVVNGLGMYVLTSPEELKFKPECYYDDELQCWIYESDAWIPLFPIKEISLTREMQNKKRWKKQMNNK